MSKTTIKHFEDGAKVWVKLNGVTYAATVLASSDVSTMEHGYEVFQLRLERQFTMLDGTVELRTWVHPKPVQGYKLKKRVE